MRMIVKTGIIAVILLACIGAVSAVNLVQNGGFETPEVILDAGWAIFPDGWADLKWHVEWANDGTLGYAGIPILANAELQDPTAIPFAPHSGEQYAELDTDWYGPSSSQSGEPANVVISQSLDTLSGQTCHISYWQSCRESDDCTVQVDWAGTPVSPSTGGPVGSWVEHTFDGTASAPTTISFTDKGLSDSIGVLIDDISVECDPINPPPVPEFPTMALPVALIVGMLGAVLFIQRNKEN